MKLLDSNIWLALALSEHVHHQVAVDWWATNSRRGSLLFCRATQQSLVRLLATDAVLAAYGNPPLSNAEAWGIYEQFLADERTGFADEPAGLEEVWVRLACRDSASPKLWMDAYLAAFAMAGSYTLITTDKAFQQHRGLDLVLLTQ